MFNIILAEDDLEVRNLFAKVLRNDRYEVITAGDGIEVLDILEHKIVDLIISDVMMPRMDWYELMKALRESGYKIPCLMITAKDSFEDLRQGFLSGADDYMIKPVNVNEMLIRVKALLRRAQMVSERKLTFGGTTFDYDSFTVTVEKEVLILPQKEFLLLYFLVSNSGKLFTRIQLMEEVWKYDTTADPHTVDVHINRIRSKFLDNVDFEIITIRGIGYKAVKKWKKKQELKKK